MLIEIIPTFTSHERTLKIAPLVGAAIATGVTALASSIGNNIAKKRAEEREAQRRQDEVTRLQQREDTSISRATRDSLSAGIDPRVNGAPPPQAGAQSIDTTPAQTADFTPIASAGSDIASAIMQQEEIDVNRNLKTAQLIETEYRDQYKEYKDGYLRSMELCNSLVQNSRETWSKEAKSSVDLDTKITDKTQSLTEFLARTKLEEGTIKTLLDSLKANTCESKSHTDKSSSPPDSLRLRFFWFC